MRFPPRMARERRRLRRRMRGRRRPGLALLRSDEPPPGRDPARPRHSLAVREQTEDVLSLVKDAETGQRGYIITGDPGYLAPFAQAVVDMPAKLAALRRLTENDPAQQARFRVSRPRSPRRWPSSTRPIRARTDLGFDVAARIIATDRGKRLMDEIRQLALEMVREEDRLYAARTARERGREPGGPPRERRRVRRGPAHRRHRDGPAPLGHARAGAGAGRPRDRGSRRRGHGELGGVVPDHAREHRRRRDRDRRDRARSGR